jgi:hypothetical protein
MILLYLINGQMCCCRKPLSNNIKYNRNNNNKFTEQAGNLNHENI